jgi:hypothetical protein
VRLIHGDDRWLFLTPEIEREVPGLLAALGAGEGAVEQARIERLIHRGGIDEWFGYLRDCRARLERAAVGDDLRPVAERLAAVLREQYLLVPALREDEEHDAPERRRLEELVWSSD